MNKEKLFVVGDVHGQITMLKELLKYWNPEEEQLLFLGDLADRGENSKATLEWARDLKKEHDAIVIKGNHDEMLEKFLENPAEHVALYYMNGGGMTDRKSTRLNSSHVAISYAVFCLKKKREMN